MENEKKYEGLSEEQKRLIDDIIGLDAKLEPVESVSYFIIEVKKDISE